VFSPKIRLLLRHLYARWLWLADQLFKKRAVMNHGLAQVFGAGLPAFLTKSALVGSTVIFEDQRMIHGDIRGTLFEIADRIAACGHHVAQQLVGVRYGRTGAVNKARLHFAPALDKSGTIARSERPDVQALDSFGALIERRFRLPPAPAVFYGAGVFSSAKLTAQSFCSAFTGIKPNSDASGHQNGKSNDYDYLCRADV
jgi:hypothetical protein